MEVNEIDYLKYHKSLNTVGLERGLKSENGTDSASIYGAVASSLDAENSHSVSS